MSEIWVQKLQNGGRQDRKHFHPYASFFIPLEYKWPCRETINIIVVSHGFSCHTQCFLKVRLCCCFALAIVAPCPGFYNFPGATVCLLGRTLKIVLNNKGATVASQLCQISIWLLAGFAPYDPLHITLKLLPCFRFCQVQDILGEGGFCG